MNGRERLQRMARRRRTALPSLVQSVISSFSLDSTILSGRFDFLNLIESTQVSSRRRRAKFMLLIVGPQLNKSSLQVIREYLARHCPKRKAQPATSNESKQKQKKQTRRQITMQGKRSLSVERWVYPAFYTPPGLAENVHDAFHISRQKCSIS